MPHIRYLDDSRLRHNEFEQGRLIVLAHLYKGVIPELLIALWFQVDVMLAVPIAPRVVHPHVIPVVSQDEGQ